MIKKTHFNLSSRNWYVQWPARSLVLSICNYLPYKHLNNTGYVNHPKNDTKLKLNIRQEIAATLKDMTGPYRGNDIPG
jgi:hypothetical protein